MSEQSEPVCVSIIFSDLIIREEGTGKNSLIGTFNNFNMPGFPYPSPPHFVTVQVTNLASNTKEFDLVVRLEDGTNGMILTSVGGHLKLPEVMNLTRESVLEIPLFVAPFIVPKAGHFKVLVLLNNLEAGHRPFSVYPVTGATQQPPKTT
jgi:hypothetical protein